MPRLCASSLIAATAAGIGLALWTPAAPASAHPLGNFSVNQLVALELSPARVEATVEIDSAELPTLQQRRTVDRDGNGTADPAERAGYAAASCATVGRALVVTVAGERLTWRAGATSFAYGPGASGLRTSRLTCQLTSPAALGEPADVAVENGFQPDRVGWREMIATGSGVRLIDPPIPARSVSDGLRRYPGDLLASPLDVRSARLRTEPGGPAAAPATAPGAGTGTGTSAGTSERASAAGVPGWLTGAQRRLETMVGEHRLTPWVGLLAVLLSLVLGAAHAALPGHGKTVMAAYLAGRRGRRRDALAVAATVTLTHTGGVLILGLLLTTTAGLVGESALNWLAAVSGAIVAAVGLGALVGALRRRGRHGHEPHGHDHIHDQIHGHGHGHGRGGGHTYHGDRDADGGGGRGWRRRLDLIGMGVAGGLVPSPSALVVLLGAVALGRTGFGVLLVLGYGVGMAAALTVAGFLLLAVRDAWARGGARRRWRLPARAAGAAPAATAGLMLLVGLGLAGRALAGMA